MHGDSSNHAPATYQMNTGSILGGKPSLGSWLTYGLGSENANLPGYVMLFAPVAVFAALSATVATKGRETVAAMLEQFGVARGSQLSPEQAAEMIEMLS
jgi:hypothetical protein